ncbi:hypothetical protein J6590_065653 [Homalodisca vitripennis]|nr:hypothetical protein J6590_065653 [Homalodisca vitripennis]
MSLDGAGALTTESNELEILMHKVYCSLWSLDRYKAKKLELEPELDRLRTMDKSESGCLADSETDLSGVDARCC